MIISDSPTSELGSSIPIPGAVELDKINKSQYDSLTKRAQRQDYLIHPSVNFSESKLSRTHDAAHEEYVPLAHCAGHDTGLLKFRHTKMKGTKLLITYEPKYDVRKNCFVVRRVPWTRCIRNISTHHCVSIPIRA